MDYEANETMKLIGNQSTDLITGEAIDRIGDVLCAYFGKDVPSILYELCADAYIIGYVTGRRANEPIQQPRCFVTNDAC